MSESSPPSDPPPPSAPPPGGAPPPGEPPAPPGATPSSAVPGAGEAAPGSGGESTNRNLMIVLAYLGPLALIPLLAEPEDKELQWHAKHGLVLLGGEIAFCLLLSLLTLVSGGLLGCFLVPVFALAVAAFLVIHIVAMVKGIGGTRLILPGISQYADRF